MNLRRLVFSIYCLFGYHEYNKLDELSDQAWLIECSHCKKRWAIKVRGDYQGARLPWTNEHRQFYKLLGYKGDY